MNKEIKTIHQINAPIDAIWSHLRTGQNVNHWLPIITSCRVEGERRYCTTEEGELEESILLSDDNKKVFKYSIDQQNLFPIKNIVGTMQLRSNSSDGTDLHWNLNFDIENEHLFPEIKSAIEGLYHLGAKGLESISKTETMKSIH